MEKPKVFSGSDEQQIWRDIAADLAQHGEFFEYAAEIHQQELVIFLSIEIDLGGGFEGGFTTTRFISPLTRNNDAFKFSIHDQHWTDQVGKLFGMEDITIGHPDLDEALVIKTNDPDKLRHLLAVPEIAQTLLNFENFNFELKEDPSISNTYYLLQFTLEEALTDPVYLREIYHLIWMANKQIT